jgi:hypothetical protein
MTPQESLEHLKGSVVEAYPLGVIVDRAAPDATHPAAAGAAAAANLPPVQGAGAKPEA